MVMGFTSYNLCTAIQMVIPGATIDFQLSIALPAEFQGLFNVAFETGNMV